MKAFIKLSTILLFILGYGVSPLETIAQNCNQNNLNIQSIEFYDHEGNPFDQDADYDYGTTINGQIFATYGGSSSNAHSLYFAYDVYINGVKIVPRVVLCLFPGTNVPQGSPQFVNNFTLNWGDRIEFKNIFMRWYTNAGNPCPAQEEGSNAQCYSSPNGFLVNTPFIPLPVVWHKLNAETQPNGKSVNIQWSTLKEWENSHFELERSIGGIDHFTKIEDIKAVGWSDQVTSYNYLDSNIPNTNDRVYYRLKQVDRNGDFEYSKVMSVELANRDLGSRSWQVYPNPSLHNDLKLNLIDKRNYNGEPIHLKMVSNQTYIHHTIAGSPVFLGADISSLIRNIPKGILILEVAWGSYSEKFKVIKQ